MSTSRMIFESGPGRVEIDGSGGVTSVRHELRASFSYLSGARVGRLRVDGVTLPPGPAEVVADVDEVELVYRPSDQLRVVVRHTFAAGWGVRVAFSSLAETTLHVEGAELDLEPHCGGLAWALALGVTGSYSVSPPDGAGPLLGGQLRRGSLDRVTPSGLELSPFVLRPRARYVVQLHWDWYATPRAFAQERHGEAPSALFLVTGEPVHVRVDEDVAVLAPRGVETTQSEHQLDISCEISGRYPFELRSARGTTAFDLQWVDPVEQVLTRLVPAALARPRTAAGIVKLSGVAEALVVQHAVALNQVDDPDEAAEALDLFTARVGASGPVTPLEAAYLCREYDRNGDPDLLRQAKDAVLAQPDPVPGLGLAATQLCLGLIVSGQPVDEVLRLLSELASDLGEPDADSSVSTQAAVLELVAVTHAGPGVSGATSRPRNVTPRIAALGLHLGAGLTGAAVDPLPVEELSHLITVFQLLPDGLSSQLDRLWGCSAHVLARQATPELLARLDGAPIGAAHAWLVLALQTT